MENEKINCRKYTTRNQRNKYRRITSIYLGYIDIDIVKKEAWFFLFLLSDQKQKIFKVFKKRNISLCILSSHIFEALLSVKNLVLVFFSGLTSHVGEWKRGESNYPSTKCRMESVLSKCFWIKTFSINDLRNLKSINNTNCSSSRKDNCGSADSLTLVIIEPEKSLFLLNLLRSRQTGTSINYTIS